MSPPCGAGPEVLDFRRVRQRTPATVGWGGDVRSTGPQECARGSPKRTRRPDVTRQTWRRRLVGKRQQRHVRRRRAVLGQCRKRLRVRLSRAFSSEELHDLHGENRGRRAHTSLCRAGRRRRCASSCGARNADLWRLELGHSTAGSRRRVLPGKG